MFELLIDRVLNWAATRNLLTDHGESNTQIRDRQKSQALKLGSECGELLDVIAKNNINDIELELGDVLVTAIILADISGITLSDSLQAALHKIEKRKGKTINGVFIKEGD